METSTIKQIRYKAIHLLEDRLLKAGLVLEVRHWANAGMTEIDLHLPEACIEEWFDVPAIKFRAAALTYRDYTPFGWDAETHTCSLLIDTGHEGAGSRWAQGLKNGDAVQYLKVEQTRQAPHPTDLVVALGDASSLGHLLALQQLTLPLSRFDGAVLLGNPEQQDLFADYFRSPLKALTGDAQLADWLRGQGYCTAHTHFYLTGNHHLVSRLRKLLKELGHLHIRAKGFWS